MSAPETPARLYLAAAPTTSASIPAIFRSSEVRELLENPPVTRHNGFNLTTYERATIDRGKRLTISSVGRKRLDLYQDGTLVAYAVFPDFLGWPRDAREFMNNPKINSIALIEFIYDFTVLYEQLLDYVEPMPASVRFVIGLRDAILPNERVLYLALYGVGSYGFEFPRESREAPDPNVDLQLDAQVSEGKPHFSPGAVAYELAERLYNWFGLESSTVPYVAPERQEVDPEAIRER